MRVKSSSPSSSQPSSSALITDYFNDYFNKRVRKVDGARRARVADPP
jgi:hypothetical protein